MKIQILFLLLFSYCLSAQNIISIDSVFAQPQSEIQIFIYIENQDPFVSFQLDVPLNEGLSYASASTVLNPERANGHSISANMIAGNVLRIFAYSFSNNSFSGNSGWVARFDLETGTGPGEYPLNIQDGIIGDQNSQNILTGTVDGLLTIVGPLSLTSYAVPESVCLGEAVQLFANPTGGTNSISFTWTSDPPGLQSNQENPVAWPTETTTYFVEAVDMFETASGQIEVSMKAGVSIIHQPQSRIVLQGDSTYFAISCDGTEPFGYQWYGPEGIIEDGIYDTLFLQNVQLQDSGFYYCEISNDCSTVNSTQAKLSVIQTIFTQSILLHEGWNSLSFHYDPVETEIQTLFQPILSKIILLSDGNSIFYPAGGINTLNTWYSRKGHFIKLSEDADLEIDGSIILSPTVNLKSGWNLIPVLADKAVQVTFLENQMGNNLIILKEMAGNKIYWPDKNIYTLNRLMPGKAYQVNVENQQTINYELK